MCQLYTTSTRDTVYLNLFYYSKHFRYSSASAAVAAVVGFFRFRLALCGTSLAVIVLCATQTNRFTSNSSDDNQKKNRSRTVPYAVVCFCLSVGGGNFNSTALLLCDDHYDYYYHILSQRRSTHLVIVYRFHSICTSTPSSIR